MPNKMYPDLYQIQGYQQCPSPRVNQQNLLNTMQHQPSYAFATPALQSNYQVNSDMYNLIGSGSQPYRNQSSEEYSSEDFETAQWDSRFCNEVEKNIKTTDKIDLVELTSKDLSPNFCNNVDPYLADVYKSTARDYPFYKYDNQWLPNTCDIYVNNQRFTELPSCAQVNHARTDCFKNISYYDKNINANANYSAQKDVEACFKNQSDFESTNNSTEMAKHVLNKENDPSSQCCNYYSLHSKSDIQYSNFEFISEQLVNQSQYTQQTKTSDYTPLLNVDQHTEVSEESDIIVEDSEDEVSETSEEQEKRFFTKTNKCVVCNLLFDPIGTQFYLLTVESPLTMSSQKPVYKHLVDLVGTVPSGNIYLCNHCLGLVNTIDHLQMKLKTFNEELMVKFKKTCTDNNVNYPKRINDKPDRRKFLLYKCKVCLKIISIKKLCLIHLKKHKRKILCELCGKIFKTLKQFKVHIRRHTTKKKIKIDPFRCSNCPKYFRTRSNLIEHENYCLAILPFNCKYCDKKFASSTKLKNHVKLKHDKKFIAICSICNMGFVDVSHYKSHKISHSTDKKFSCLKCDKSYKTLSNLNFHMKSHKDKLPFQCPFCNKGFMRKEYLEAHVNNHKGIKNFSCTYCEKKFVSQKNLDSHLKYHEGTVKKKTCNICGKSMSTGFEEHLRTHLNLLEFECDLCEMKFNTKGAFSKHKKMKHVLNTDKIS